MTASINVTNLTPGSECNPAQASTHGQRVREGLGGGFGVPRSVERAAEVVVRRRRLLALASEQLLARLVVAVQYVKSESKFC
jgi:hypothetical protein